MSTIPPSSAQLDATRMMRYDANKKSTGVAYLLWLFFGALGGHRFYLGRTGSAVAMLALFIVSFALSFVVVGGFGLLALGIWVLVDAFLIPGLARDHNNRLIRELAT